MRDFGNTEMKVFLFLGKCLLKWPDSYELILESVHQTSTLLAGYISLRFSLVFIIWRSVVEKLSAESEAAEKNIFQAGEG